MRRLILVLLFILVAWAVWMQMGRNTQWDESNPAIDHKELITSDSICTRNVVGIQPFMVSTDYLSNQHFYEKMKAYFEASKQAGYFNKNTVVLLPEYLGTWLVINNEKYSVAEAKTITGAMALMVLSNPVKFVQSFLLHQNEGDVVAASIFRMKSENMAAIYADTFKNLAKTYQVTINAGSIVLPGPSVENNDIKTNSSEPLYNSSFIFYPDGLIDQQVIRKSFPIKSELPFVTAYPINELPVYDLSIGRTSVLVCADSWYPESYAKIKESKAEVVLVNSYCAGNNTMAALWNGYDGIKMPEDVDPTDVYSVRESEAWMKYALPGRIKNSNASVGVNIFLRGELWDLGTDGQPFIVKDGKLLEVGTSERGGIWSLCF